jgi:acyl transferase domain-containing protein/NAD(P)-dependent dehydrogenase (short-subunit alcohol dehydrogenase family)/acyl carrier protein
MSRDTMSGDTDTDHHAAGAAAGEPIAVVGIGLRFPGGSESFDEFDAFLRDGRSGIRPIPEDRWDVAAFTPDGPDDRGKIRTGSGGYLDRIDLFDAPFFNISPKEAHYIDPQQRIVLETAWHALEHANIDPTTLRRGNGGVYVGASSIDYALELDALPYSELDGHLAAGITLFPLSGRLSYFLGWRGPSISVDTACSSSLTALHMAVLGLRAGECDIALCGGVNALHHPRIPVMFSHAQMLAPDGQCKTFDESADGYARAEGCGMLVLKRLADALRDEDTVLAVVRGTAIGQDGDSAGLTVPHGPAQERVMRAALDAAGWRPEDVQYVEAHGTGTPLGDPIELRAINEVFAGSRTREESLVVGSVKTNLGHMEPASGVVGLIKVVAQLRSRTIYPHLNLTTPSSRIPWDSYRVRVPTAAEPWRAPVPRALVNSFGFAGSIGAAVLEPAPVPAGTPPERTDGPSVFTLSARGAPALRQQIERYQRFLADQPDIDVHRLCHTGNVGRAHFGHRLAGVVHDRADLLRLLDTSLSTVDDTGSSGVRKVGFLCAGQGSQYPGMGAPLYRRFPAFRACVDECDRLFSAHLDESVRALLLGTAADPDLINQTAYTQPALFTLEYALARQWQSWGVRPSVLIGHSIGEVVAATVAGVFTLADAVTLVAARARLMQSVRVPGGMAAVNAPADDVRPLLAGHPRLALAAVNAPDQCVLSGPTDSLAAVVDRLREQHVRADRLAVSHAFHSPLMAEVFDDFRAAIDGIEFHEPTITLVSNLTGKIARLATIGAPDYWVRHIGSPVLFLDGMRAAARRGRHAFVELGPSSALTALGRRCLPADEHAWFTSARRADTEGDTILHTLAGIYSLGLPVSWSGVHAGRSPGKVTLPGYVFNHKRYWLPVGKAKTPSGSAAAHDTLVVRECRDRTDGVREFVTECGPASPAFLADHAGALPVAGYVELLLAVQDAVFGHTRRTIRDLRLVRPLPLPENGTTVRTTLSPAGHAEVVTETGQTATATIGEEDPPRLSATGQALLALADQPGPVVDSADRQDIHTDLASVGRDHGERFQLLAAVRRHPDDVLTADLSDVDPDQPGHLPVPVLECALHALAALDPDGPSLASARIDSIRVLKKPRRACLRVVARYTAGRTADLVLLEGDTPVAELLGVRLARSDRRQFRNRLAWLRRSLPHATASAARHVLAVHGDSAPGTSAGAQVSAVDDVAELDEKLDSSVTDVCWFWRRVAGEPSVATLRAESELNYRDLLDLLSIMDKADQAHPPRLWLVTSGAQWLPEDTAHATDPLAATSLWGFARAVLDEYPQYRATLVDLAGDADPAPLLAELTSGQDDERQLAYRGGRRFVRRLLSGPHTPAWDGNFQARRGDTVTIEPAADVPPAPGEIQVRVRAVGLTWWDGEAAEPGRQCAGTVIAAGEGAEFDVADDVIVWHDGVLAGTVTVPAHAAARKPAALDFAEAAALSAHAGSPESVPPDMLRGVVDLVSRDRLPPLPVTTYSLDELDEALRVARRGDTAGLPVVCWPADRTPPADVPVRPDRTYLVTGGLGGVGLVTARKLADLGARHLVLASRSGRPVDAEAAGILADLSDRASVSVVKADVAEPDQVADLFAGLATAPHPLGGVVHAAGQVGELRFQDLTWAAIDEQLRARVYGGWLLHEHTRHVDSLDFFVLTGSVSATSAISVTGQAHYAAASAFLDGLATWRARQGLPGLAVDWGPWARIGMSARLDPALARRIESTGLRFFSPGRAMRTLRHALGGHGQLVVGEFDWDRLAGGSTLFDRLVDPDRPAARADNLDLTALLAKPKTERTTAIGAFIRDKVAAALHFDDADGVDPGAEFVSLGLDSLMAQGLKSELESAFRLVLPASVTFDHPTVRRLAEFLDDRLGSSR